VVQLWDFVTLQLLQSLHVVVGLREGWELIARSQVLVTERSVDSVGEKDLVVDVDVLLDGLVRVERGELAFNNGLGPLNGSFHEVLVHFKLCSVFLDSVKVGFRWEVLNNLELFVPVTHRSWVVPEQWANRLVYSF